MAIRQGRHKFSQQTAVIYGYQAAEAIAEQIASSGKLRAFVIVSPSVARGSFYRGLLEILGARLAGAFTACAPHSPLDDVVSVTQAARELNADLLIAVGGGSVIDTTKAVQALLRLDSGSSSDLSNLSMSSPRQNVSSVHSIAVPTTLSAAEFTNIVGLTDVRRGVKQIYEAPALYIDTVVLDPAATMGVPTALFLATGIRAVDHCIETLCSKYPSVVGDACAREGLSLLAHGLPVARADPGNLEARMGCQLGAWLSITGFTSGVPVGASHAIGRVLGGAFGVAHGHTSCALLPSVLRWNERADDGRQPQIIAAMQAGETSACEAVARLIADLGMPTRLRDLGISPDRFREIADKSLVMVGYPSTSGNPRPVETAQDIIDILELAY